jgi:hypothetical protein
LIWKTFHNLIFFLKSIKFFESIIYFKYLCCCNIFILYSKQNLHIKHIKILIGENSTHFKKLHLFKG